ENYREALIAELDEMGFEGFQQHEDEIDAFIPQNRFHIGDREHIQRLLAVYPGRNFIQTEEIIERQNWNREWEKTIQPQQIGSFLVKPTWSNKEGRGQIVLQIDPKMAFGTGYHATTRLMLKELPNLISSPMNILDAGTGTGILAIASIKLGASKVVAFDNDEWSIQNTRENIILNDTAEQIEVRAGSMEVIDSKEKFDAILSNINKNTILQMLESFQKHLEQNGKLLLAGILKSDEGEVSQQLDEAGFELLRVSREESWIAVLAEK